MTGMPRGVHGGRSRRSPWGSAAQLQAHAIPRRGTSDAPAAATLATPTDSARLAIDRAEASHPVSLEGVRLALVSDTYLPQLNGVTRTLARLVSQARARGGEVEVFTTSDPLAAEEDGIRRTASIPFWGYPQLRLAAPDAAAVERGMRDWGATLVHAATPFGMGLAARRAARRAAIPFVTSYHTHFVAYAHYYQLGWLHDPGWRFLRWFHNSGARTYCPTGSVAGELAAKGFARTAVWGRGVDATVFAPAHRALEARRSLGIGDRELLVLYVGRVAREKGLDDILAAMRLLRALPDAPTCRLLVVGDGPYLETCARREADHVVFAGRRTGTELSQLYASADLFVFPSTTDTFGNVTLEAMASGLPVIAADSGVNRELVTEGAGSWYPAGEPAALATHIARWGREPALRRGAGMRGREAALCRSWDRVFDELFFDYRQVLDERVAAR